MRQHDICENCEPCSSRGFSLLELLVVVGILVSVSAIVLTLMFRMSISQGTMANRTQMHAGVRSATELLQQEVGQAGRIAIPTSTTPTSPVTLSAAVAGSGTSQSIAVSSTVGMFPGETLLIGPDGTNGSLVEPLFVTSLTSSAVTSVWQAPHASGAPVNVMGTFPAGIIPPATDANCLGGGSPPACRELSISGSNPATIVVTTLSAAQASTGSVLKMFGDINGDGIPVYVEYWCDTDGGNLYRNVVTLPAPGTDPTTANKGSVTGSQVLLPNILPNPGGVPCFDYQVKAVGNNTYVLDVAITLTVQTQFRDPKTNQFQTETKALLNVSPRNVFEAWRIASAGVPSRLQPMPEAVLVLAGQTTE
ncbi:MAG: type II secretion system protein [Acidobacteria bacterium]|nr:type II secretion system protein [Acidobacteriota bacterium]